MGLAYDALIRTFEDGEWVLGIFCWLIAGVIGFLAVAGLSWAQDEMAWSKICPFECEATLISGSYVPSTLQTKGVTTVGANGQIGFGAVTTGHEEGYITFWDCGKYGKVKSEDKEVYRWAQPQSILFLKEKGSEIRIDGIKKP